MIKYPTICNECGTNISAPDKFDLQHKTVSCSNCYRDYPIDTGPKARVVECSTSLSHKGKHYYALEIDGAFLQMPDAVYTSVLKEATGSYESPHDDPSMKFFFERIAEAINS